MDASDPIQLAADRFTWVDEDLNNKSSELTEGSTPQGPFGPNESAAKGRQAPRVA
jgi:hypothetical protein